MGLILDSSVLIEGERRAKTVHQTLAAIAALTGDSNFGISAITIAELAHGVSRAPSFERASTRRRFLEDAIQALVAHPVSTEIALATGLLDGRLASVGIRVALPDLFIGVTALELGYAVATHNVRHFRLIPDLEVVTL